MNQGILKRLLELEKAVKGNNLTIIRQDGKRESIDLAKADLLELVNDDTIAAFECEGGKLEDLLNGLKESDTDEIESILEVQ